MIIQFLTWSAVKLEKLVEILFGILPTSAGITILSLDSSSAEKRAAVIIPCVSHSCNICFPVPKTGYALTLLSTCVGDQIKEA